MPGPKIPETDHVTLLCGATKCDDKGRPQGSAFFVKPDHSYLSVNWLEFTRAQSRAEQLACVRKYLKDKGMTLGAKAWLPVLHLQSSFDLVASEWKGGPRLSAHHESERPHDLSHAGIYGYRPEDAMVADLLALSVAEIHPARG